MRVLRSVLMGAFFVIFALITSGCCRIETDFIISSDGSVTVSENVAYLKETMDSLGNSKTYEKQYKVKEIDGEKYYVNQKTETTTVKKWNKKNSSNILLGKNKIFIYYETSQTNTGDLGKNASYKPYYRATVTFDNEIVKTNGTVDENDKRKVEFVYDSTEGQNIEWYAYTDESGDPEADKKAMKKKADKKPPVIKGIKDLKVYKNKATAYIKDNVKLKKVTVNGKKVKLKKLKLMKSGKYKGYYRLRMKTGKKVQFVRIEATDNNNNIKTAFFHMKGTRKAVKKVKKAIVIF